MMIISGSKFTGIHYLLLEPAHAIRIFGEFCWKKLEHDFTPKQFIFGQVEIVFA